MASINIPGQLKVSSGIIKDQLTIWRGRFRPRLDYKCTKRFFYTQTFNYTRIFNCTRNDITQELRNTVGTPHKNIGGLARVLLLVLLFLLFLLLFLFFPLVTVIIQGLVLLSMFFWTRFDCTPSIRQQSCKTHAAQRKDIQMSTGSWMALHTEIRVSYWSVLQASCNVSSR